MPAAAVIRRARALSGFIGRKAFRRRLAKFLVKSQGLTLDMPKKLAGLRSLGDARIPGGGVKSVDIRKNTKGEGKHLERT